MPDVVDQEIELQQALENDKRIASAPEGYATTDDALVGLDDAERLRYLYLERERLLAYAASGSDDPEIVPVLRAVAHDEAIRQIAASRAGIDGVVVAWDGAGPERQPGEE
jgi:hypothetical protein